MKALVYDETTQGSGYTGGEIPADYQELAQDPGAAWWRPWPKWTRDHGALPGG